MSDNQETKLAEGKLIKMLETGSALPTNKIRTIFDYATAANRGEDAQAKSLFSRLLKGNFSTDLINRSWRDMVNPSKPTKIHTKKITSEPYIEGENRSIDEIITPKKKKKDKKSESASVESE